MNTPTLKERFEERFGDLWSKDLKNGRILGGTTETLKHDWAIVDQENIVNFIEKEVEQAREDEATRCHEHVEQARKEEAGKKLDPLRILIEGTEERKLYNLGLQEGRSTSLAKDWEKKFDAKFQIAYGNGDRKKRLDRPVEDIKDFITSIVSVHE